MVYGNVYDALIGKIWFLDEAEKLRKRARKHICSMCDASCDTAFAFGQEFFYYAKFLLKEKSKKLSRHWGQRMLNWSTN